METTYLRRRAAQYGWRAAICWCLAVHLMMTAGALWMMNLRGWCLLDVVVAAIFAWWGANSLARFLKADREADRREWQNENLPDEETVNFPAAPGGREPSGGGVAIAGAAGIHRGAQF